MESDQSFGHCKSLVKLNIEDTKVTTKGARLAMEHLPKLQFFKCPFSLYVAAKMRRKDRKSPQLVGTGIRQLSLMDLRFIGDADEDIDVPYKRGDLKAAIELCPSIVHVKIRAAWDATFTDKELKSLLKLKNLRHLCVEASNSVSFEGGLLPILEKFGPSTLEKLQLKYLPDVDVSAIAKHCPNLRSLSLVSIERYICRPLKPTENRLNCLEYLEMIQMDNDEIGLIRPPPTAADLRILLSPLSLVTLNFAHFDGLSDDLIEEIALSRGFSNLKVADFEFCGGITERSIECLLTLDNPLKKMFVYLMEHSREEYLNKWENQAKKNNWDLSFIV